MTAGTDPATGAAAEPRSIDMRDWGQIVRRRWLLIVTVTLLGALAAVGYAVLSGHKYAATSEVVVASTGGQGGSATNQASSANSSVNMSTEQTIAQSPPVVARGAKTLGVPVDTLQAEAAKQLTITVPASQQSTTTSNVLQITWTGHSPKTAQAGANAFAAGYLSYRHQALTAAITSLRNQYQAQLTAVDHRLHQLDGQVPHTPRGSPARAQLYFELNQLHQQSTTLSNSLASLASYNANGGYVISAALPTKSSGLSHKVIAVLGVLLGLIIGLVLAFVRDTLDDRVREPAQLERSLGAPTLAVLPPEEGAAGSGVLASAIVTDPNSRAAEDVRALRATLAVVAERGDQRTILVAAADASVSSSRIAAGIGLAMAESGRRVLLVAADLGGSALPHIFGLENNAGLSELLTGNSDPRAVIWQPKQADGTKLPGSIARRLGVLPSGIVMPHALSVLDSSAMAGLLRSQRESYDLVVLDSPPVTDAADAFALAGQVDGVIVVARAVRSRRRALEELRRRLAHVGAVVVGGVLVGAGPAARHRRSAPVPDAADSQALSGRPHRPAVEPSAAGQPPYGASAPLPHDATSSPASGRTTRL
jgi:capsular exopolysaccharide synthesis family protein